MAEYAVTSFGGIIPIPDDPSLTFDKASSFFVNPLTAICMVERVEELGSSACIVTAAGSAIGRMIVPLLLEKNITPICLVRRAE